MRTSADVSLDRISLDVLEGRERSLVVIGGDSLIGEQVLTDCAKLGVATQASTRRAERIGSGRFFLDLTSSHPEEHLPDNLSPILIVAAITGFAACDTDTTSATVNLDAPVVLVRAALAAGRRVVYVSTNSVFGGDVPFCNEDDNVNPEATYSKQKAEAERQLRALAGWSSNGAVVRLTKVLSPNTSPIQAWRRALGRGEPISPFSDMVFAPISLQFAARSLIQLAMSSLCGNFHVSGASDISYAEFALHYVAAKNFDPRLVLPTTVAKAGFNLLFRPAYSALGTTRTQQLANVAPQSLRSVVEDLLQAEQSKNPGD